jgi:hypothetical protein
VQACALSLHQNNASIQVQFISCVMSTRRPPTAGSQVIFVWENMNSSVLVLSLIFYFLFASSWNVHFWVLEKSDKMRHKIFHSNFFSIILQWDFIIDIFQCEVSVTNYTNEEAAFHAPVTKVILISGTACIWILETLFRTSNKIQMAEAFCVLHTKSYSWWHVLNCAKLMKSVKSQSI